MINRHFFFFTAFYLLTLPIFSQTENSTIIQNKIQIPEDSTFWSDYPNEQLASFITDRMTDEELLAQILMFGWAGSEPSPLLMDWIKLRSLGSVKVFGWSTNNVIDVAKSVHQVQQQADKCRFRIPLYIATDQEGGWIRHIKGRTSDTPGNLAIGASGLPSDAYYSGYYIAKELRALGINMNFAPTVDIYTNLHSTVIGPRSFSSNPEHTGILGASYSAGVMDAGVIPTAKHFPGHGDTSDDSHGHLPEINISKETLHSRELIPFIYLIKENIPAIMVGHLNFPQITKNGEPATLSNFFLNDLLRNELGYKGLIITDDMMMNGATIYAGNLSTAFRLAIEAGNDIIISSKTAQLSDPLWINNLNRISVNPKFKSIVKKAAYHVVLSKLEYFKQGNPVPIFPDINSVEQNVPDPEGTKFFINQACKSITLYSGNAENLIINKDKNVLIVGQYSSFLDEAKKQYPNAQTVLMNFKMGPNETAWTTNKIINLMKDYDTLILGCANEESVKIAKEINKLNFPDKKIIFISIMSPVYFFDTNWLHEVLLCYSYSPFSFNAIFSVLKGDFIPKGILPLPNESY